MTTRILIASAEGHTGKSTVALGVLELLRRSATADGATRVGVFRPVARTTLERDYVLDLLLDRATVDLPYEDCIGTSYEAVHADPDAALEEIVRRFGAVEARCDAVVIIGSDYTDVGSPTELSFNARVAANLSAPVLLVLGGRTSDGSAARTPDELRQVAEVTVAELRSAHAGLVAVVVNRADPHSTLAAEAAVSAAVPDVPVWAIAEDPSLVAPTFREVVAAVDGELVRGDDELADREVLGTVISAMTFENALPRLTEGAAVIVPGDRSDVLVGMLLANAADTFPSLTGVILNGGFEPVPSIERLLDGLGSPLPIARSPHGTFETAMRITRTRGILTPASPRKIETALAHFDAGIDGDELLRRLDVAPSDVVTPLMFEHQLLQRAAGDPRHIVLPEGDDDRILRAAGALLTRRVARLTIIGDPSTVRARASELGIDLADADILSPFDEPLRSRFAEEYARLRAHKGITVDQAADTITDVSYFGTMMVHTGLADGMVSGAAHTTAHTIRPAFEIIKTKPGVSVVSSVFLMALADRVLVYGDCAVIPDPTAEQLADIAISSAGTAAAFGIDPRIAMLSYSTGESGSGADVEKVRAGTAIVRERRPDLLVEGPIQYDAAADATVAAAKAPGSAVAGRATVFVFPDLNTGNNTYKAVQRSAGAVAIGPVLQGLNRPVNDLSRGALVRDIVNTVAITAIQAQAEPRAARPEPSAPGGDGRG